MSEAYVDENMDCRPSPGVQFNPKANISPEEGFLLSQADGRLSIRDIVNLLPFPKAKVGEMLVHLRRTGMLDWEGGTEPPDAPEAPSATADSTPTTETGPADDALFDDDLDDNFGMTGFEAKQEDDAGDAFGFAATAPAADTPEDEEDVVALLDEIETGQHDVPDKSDHSQSREDIDDQTLSELDALMEDMDDLDDEVESGAEPGTDDETIDALIESMGDHDPEPEEISEIDSELFDEIGAVDEDFDTVIAELEDSDQETPDEITDPEISMPEAQPPVTATPKKPAPRPAAAGVKQTDPAKEINQLRQQIELQQKLLTRNDPFQALSVKGGSSDKEIRDAWHRLSRKFHPDRYYSLDLPDDLAAELDDLFTQLQQAYETIATREARREYMFSLRDARMSGSRARQEKQDANPDQSGPGEGSETVIDADRLATLAEEALQRGQYRSAKTNFQLAAQIAQSKEYRERAKLVDLLEMIEGRILKLLNSGESPYIDDVKSTMETIHKIEPILPKSASLLKTISTFLYEHGDDPKLAKRVVERLLKCNRLPDTLILAARINVQNGLPQTALDLLEDAKQRDPGNSEVKNLIKETKRSLKK